MQQAKNFVGWLAFITCIVMGVYLLLPGKETNQDVQEITQLELQHLCDSTLIDHYRSLYLSVIDTVYTLRVEKGQIEIEKNRLEEKLKNSSNSYKENKQVKDTAKAIQFCDSIVYTYLPHYFEIDSTLSLFVDSTENYYAHKWESLYIIGDTIANRLTFTDSLALSFKKENIKLKAENKVNKRKVLKAGFFGAAIGVLVTLISSFF